MTLVSSTKRIVLDITYRSQLLSDASDKGLWDSTPT